MTGVRGRVDVEASEGSGGSEGEVGTTGRATEMGRPVKTAGVSSLMIIVWRALGRRGRQGEGRRWRQREKGCLLLGGLRMGPAGVGEAGNLQGPADDLALAAGTCGPERESTGRTGERTASRLASVSCLGAKGGLGVEACKVQKVTRS